MHTISKSTRTLLGPRLGRSVGIALLSALSLPLQRVLRWLELSRQRRHLALLDDRLLRDLGLSRSDVSSETDKPFWRE
ncbi:MAG: hypothetical protein BroJett029_12080 [Alphaproteobacteria bacterium]|nr:MAG: hypothetical protein BroJett029_12080 [Alphaproteobacteria bacterium]